MPLSAAGNVKRGRVPPAGELGYDKAFHEVRFREKGVFRAPARAHGHARRERSEAREPPSYAQRGEGRAVQGMVLRCAAAGRGLRARGEPSELQF
jgi:hypothetical protein